MAEGVRRTEEEAAFGIDGGRMKRWRGVAGVASVVGEEDARVEEEAASGTEGGTKRDGMRRSQMERRVVGVVSVVGEEDDRREEEMAPGREEETKQDGTKRDGMKRSPIKHDLARLDGSVGLEHSDRKSVV